MVGVYICPRFRHVMHQRYHTETVGRAGKASLSDRSTALRNYVQYQEFSAQENDVVGLYFSRFD